MIDWFERTYQYLSHLDTAQIEKMLQQYSSLGPLPGVLLPMSEAVLSFLPLFVIVAGNASAYGLWPGFFYSWIGTVLGAVLVFWLARKFGRRFGAWIEKTFPKTERFFGWVERKGFTPLFLLYCFPFTPSLVVNITSGMSKIPFGTFLMAVMSGKAVMVLMMSYFGHDWQGFVAHPWRITLAAAVLLVLWYIGKKVEKMYQIR